MRRMVVTSSFAAINDAAKGFRPGYVYSERDWNPLTYEEAKGGTSAQGYLACKKVAEEGVGVCERGISL